MNASINDAQDSAEAGDLDGAKRDRGLRQISEQVLREVSENLLDGARQIALESDNWFLSTVRGLDKGAKHTKAAISKMGSHVVQKSNNLRPSWLRKKTQRQRIQEMLMREAKRAKVDLSGQEFDLFSEQIATLVELVLKGSVSVADIAFEQDEHSRLLDQAMRSNGSD